MSLYHYTCDHWAPYIQADGLVKPSAVHGWPGLTFGWFTDLEVPYREALGLTQRVLSCDRTTARFTVTDERGIRPWLEARRDFPPRLAAALHTPPGVMPAHWWVAVHPVPVELG